MEISQLNSLFETDALAINQLSQQLGYTTEAASLQQRLAQILTLNDHAVFVAKLNGEIVGWLHCLICLRVESPLFVEVTGLVVDQNVRGQQIGKGLIDASKNWSRNHHILEMRIRCNVIRTESHKFYKALGFETRKEQKVFAMAL